MESKAKVQQSADFLKSLIPLLHPPYNLLSFAHHVSFPSFNMNFFYLDDEDDMDMGGGDDGGMGDDGAGDDNGGDDDGVFGGDDGDDGDDMGGDDGDDMGGEEESEDGGHGESCGC